MKRINNIYNKIYDLNNILTYEHVISVNTKNKCKVEKYEEYFAENIYRIREKLITKTYIPGRYNIFLIKEPKVRLIMSQNIEDKIINHLVSKYFLSDIFDNSLINSNIATRKNMGTHYGIKLLTRYLKECRTKKVYFLKFDISKYFFNIDHNIVKKIIRNKIKDKNVINILDRIIDSTDEEYVNVSISNIKNKEINRIKNLNISDNLKKNKIDEVEKIPIYKKGKGFPIGNMSSQIVAILYLNELDHYIKEKLKIKYYIRYMDDGILIHEDRKYLEYCLNEIRNILEKYNLELNHKKTYIDSINNGLDFLGFRFFIKNDKIIRKLRKDTKKRLKKNININNMASYYGCLKWGSCGNLIHKYIDNLKRKEPFILEGGK